LHPIKIIDTFIIKDGREEDKEMFGGNKMKKNFKKRKINERNLSEWLKMIKKAALLEDKLFNPIREKRDDEIEVTQYLRPNGQKRKMYAKVGEDIAKKAEGLVLSAEMIPTGLIAIYARRRGDSEEKMRLAENGPGENSPTNRLIELINSFKENK